MHTADSTYIAAAHAGVPAYPRGSHRLVGQRGSLVRLFSLPVSSFPIYLSPEWMSDQSYTCFFSFCLTITRLFLFTLTQVNPVTADYMKSQVPLPHFSPMNPAPAPKTPRINSNFGISRNVQWHQSYRTSSWSSHISVNVWFPISFLGLGPFCRFPRPTTTATSLDHLNGRLILARKAFALNRPLRTGQI